LFILKVVYPSLQIGNLILVSSQRLLQPLCRLISPHSLALELPCPLFQILTLNLDLLLSFFCRTFCCFQVTQFRRLFLARGACTVATWHFCWCARGSGLCRQQLLHPICTPVRTPHPQKCPTTLI